MSPRALTPCSTHAYATQKGAMLALAHEVRNTSRYIGMMPFVVYAYLRSVRVGIFFVDRLVDIVAEYAPFLSETLYASPSAIHSDILPLHGIRL